MFVSHFNHADGVDNFRLYAADKLPFMVLFAEQHWHLINGLFGTPQYYLRCSTTFRIADFYHFQYGGKQLLRWVANKRAALPWATFKAGVSSRPKIRMKQNADKHELKAPVPYNGERDFQLERGADGKQMSQITLVFLEEFLWQFAALRALAGFYEWMLQSGPLLMPAQSSRPPKNLLPSGCVHRRRRLRDCRSTCQTARTPQ